MTKLGLMAAARAAGVSKTTMRRMVEAGRISAQRGEDGAFLIDASELGRFMDSRPSTPTRTQSESEIAPERIEASREGAGELEELRRRLEAESRATLAEERLKLLNAQLEASERRAEEWRSEAGAWRAQAERLLIASETTKTPEPKQGLWRRVLGGGKSQG